MIPESLKNLAVPVADVRPYPRNPRNGDLEAIKGSLQVNGQYRPIVVNSRTGEILAGNHTYMAAMELGWDEIAATYVDADEEQAKRIVLVDNRTNDLAIYENAALVDLLAELPDLEGTGFAPDDLADMASRLDRTPGNDTEPKALPPEPVSSLGDLYLLGEHRVLCGDATSATDVDYLLGANAMVDLIITDPPYGVAYVGRTDRALTIKNDALGAQATQALFADALAASHLRQGGVFYATVPSGEMLRWFLEVPDLALGTGALRQVLIWVKNRFVLGRSDYHYRHEAILHGHAPGDAPVFEPNEVDSAAPFADAHEFVAYGWRPGSKHSFYGGRKQDTVWEVDRATASREHPTMKPVSLFERMLDNSSRGGNVVYDPFGGSGTTLIACENLSRRARLMELDPAYVDVIVDRWERHTGQTAERTRADGSPVEALT